MKEKLEEDRQKLYQLEDVINTNILQSYRTLGDVLIEIRDRELFKIKDGGVFETFEEYCNNALPFNYIRAVKLIGSREAVSLFALMFKRITS